MEKIEKFPNSIGNLFKLFFVSVAISIILAIIFLIIGEIIEALFYPDNTEFDILSINSIGGILLEICSFGFLLFYITTKPNRTWAEFLRFKPFYNLTLIPLTILIIGNGIVLSEIDNFFRLLIPIPETFNKFMMEIRGHGILSFIPIVVLAPIFEEILFRGVILEGLLSKYNRRRAILYSALIFSIIHINPLQLFGAFIIGIILGFLYTHTRSLIPCIFGHALHNGLTWAIQFLPIEISGLNSNPLTIPPQFQPLWLDLIGLILLFVGIWGLMKAIKKSSPARKKNIELYFLPFHKKDENNSLIQSFIKNLSSKLFSINTFRDFSFFLPKKGNLELICAHQKQLDSKKQNSNESFTNFWSKSDNVYLVFVSSGMKENKSTIEVRIFKITAIQKTRIIGMRFLYASKNNNQLSKMVNISANQISEKFQQIIPKQETT